MKKNNLYLNYVNYIPIFVIEGDKLTFTNAAEHVRLHFY